MNPMERLLTALSFKEADKIPLFLLLTVHGAKELGISIKDYFSKSSHVVKGQLKMLSKYRNDCIYSFFYAPSEVEAWGAEVLYTEDGPPNSGEPFIKKIDEIRFLEPPKVSESSCLIKQLDAVSDLKKEVKDTVPIIGVVMSPFSLPVMQLGFDKYLDLLYGYPSLFERLIHINKIFCIEWANAQIHAGASAIVYFDPVSSTTVVDKKLSLEKGLPIAKDVLSKIKGPAAIHFASGRCEKIAEDVSAIGAVGIGISSLDDLSSLKKKTYGKASLIGNLNGIEMRRWTPAQTEQKIKELIRQGAAGGGLVISDHHGELPYFITDEILFAMRDAVDKWGKYPLDWIHENE